MQCYETSKSSIFLGADRMFSAELLLGTAEVWNCCISKYKIDKITFHGHTKFIDSSLSK